MELELLDQLLGKTTATTPSQINLHLDGMLRIDFQETKGTKDMLYGWFGIKEQNKPSEAI